MISKLKGILDEVFEDSLTLDVGGVGYHVHTSRQILSQLPNCGEALSLVIDTHIRQDAITLYGFCDKSEKKWFQLLLTVQGVGAKAALSLLSTLSLDELAQAILANDKAMICRADGIGPKIASRLISELKEKTLPTFLLGLDSPKTPSSSSNSSKEAMEALLSLGYSRSEIYMVLQQLETSTLSTEDVIKQALKLLFKPSF